MNILKIYGTDYNLYNSLLDRYYVISEIRYVDDTTYYISNSSTDCRETLNTQMYVKDSKYFIMSLERQSVSRILKVIQGTPKIELLLTRMGVDKELYEISEITHNAILVKINFNIKEKIFTFSLITFALRALIRNKITTPYEDCFKYLRDYYGINPYITFDILSQDVIDTCDNIYAKTELPLGKLSLAGPRTLGRVLQLEDSTNNLKERMFRYVTEGVVIR